MFVLYTLVSCIFAAETKNVPQRFVNRLLYFCYQLVSVTEEGLCAHVQHIPV